MAEYKDLTDEEYDALDEYYTTHTPKIDTSRPGFFARKGFTMVTLDNLTAAYLKTKAETVHKTPTQLISEMVRHEMAYA
ncbi:MAG: hypothetical protein LBM77_06655 [Spirochaetaceae bacterium]|jgi:N-acetylglutamate synthase-like GNAT family acetyltransferase|nr:hypothetical protein [Spirochaetaceae bacterium]